MVRFFVATTNTGKLRDFAAASAGAEIELAPLPGLHEIPPPAEDEATFEGNARVKALFYSQFAPGALVLADDSGLEVDALRGAPGVRSARYAEDAGYGTAALTLDERNNLCLAEALRDVPEPHRRARYRCVLVAARDGAVVAVGTGTVEGRIAATASGSGGFGYDPWFVPDGEERSMAALEPAVRLRLSHRGRALADLLAKWA